MTLVLDQLTLVRAGEMYIEDVSLEFERGVFNLLLGPTLAGKTSLLRLMAGLEKPTLGRIRFDGIDVTGVPVQKRKVAMVYQQFINYPSMSVFENIASPLRVAGLSSADVRTQVRQIADLLQLGPLLNRRPAELSGGQQQRTALARALVKQAELVLLDEPLANLDYKLREDLRNELPRLFADTGATVVYATAEPTEALILGGFTATLHEGRVTQFGQTHAVFRAPNSLTSAETFSDPPLNVADVEKALGRFVLDGSVAWPVTPRHASLPDGPYTLGFRPHHLALSSAGEGALSTGATVSIAEISGSETFVHLSSGESHWVAQTHGVHRLSIGDSIDVSVDPRHFLLFRPDGSRVETIVDESGYG